MAAVEADEVRGLVGVEEAVLKGRGGTARVDEMAGGEGRWLWYGGGAASGWLRVEDA